MKRMDLNGGVKPEGIPLFHGSKGGIIGTLGPKSRATCDFGSAFYLGTMREQAFSICLGSKKAHFYECALCLDGLQVEDLSGLSWMLYVAYNRGLLSEYNGCTLFQTIQEFKDSTDVVVGDIADDSIYPAFDDFVEGRLTDRGLIAVLSALKLGAQYALLTRTACVNVTVKEVFPSAGDIQRFQEVEVERSLRSKQVLRQTYSYYRNIGNTIYDYEKRGVFDASFESLRTGAL